MNEQLDQLAREAAKKLLETPVINDSLIESVIRSGLDQAYEMAIVDHYTDAASTEQSPGYAALMAAAERVRHELELLLATR
jgi:hypothetical protein